MANDRSGLLGGLLALLGIGGVGSLAALPKLAAHAPEFAVIAARAGESAALHMDDAARGAAAVSHFDDGLDGAPAMQSLDELSRDYSRTGATPNREPLEINPESESFASRTYAQASEFSQDILKEAIENCLSGCDPQDPQDDREDESLRSLAEPAARADRYAPRDEILPVRSFSQFRTSANAEIAAAAATIGGIFPNEGMSGLMVRIDECYEEQIQSPSFCVYLDIGAGYLDHTFAGIMKVPPMEFFADEKFLPRTSKALGRAGLSEDQALEFLKEMVPTVVRNVDYALLLRSEERENGRR